MEQKLREQAGTPLKLVQAKKVQTHTTGYGLALHLESRMIQEDSGKFLQAALLWNECINKFLQED